jgi:tellurite resistance protein
VAGVALFALNGPRVTSFASALAGYAVLMALVQLRFLSVYVTLPFSPGFWTFTFSYAVSATDALEWISAKRPTGSLVYAACVLTAVTLLIGVISVRTVVLLFRGRLFPPSPLAADFCVDFGQGPGEEISSHQSETLSHTAVHV